MNTVLEWILSPKTLKRVKELNFSSVAENILYFQIEKWNIFNDRIDEIFFFSMVGLKCFYITQNFFL